MKKLINGFISLFFIIFGILHMPFTVEAKTNITITTSNVLAYERIRSMDNAEDESNKGLIIKIIADVKTFFMRYITCFIFGIIFASIIFHHKMININRANQDIIDNLQSQLQKKQKSIELLEMKSTNLSIKVQQLAQRYDGIENKYTTLLDKYKRANALHPDLDEFIITKIREEQIQKDMDIAQEIDAKIQNLMVLPPSKDIISDIGEALKEYSKLTKKQKSYVKSIIRDLQKKYDICLRLK